MISFLEGISSIGNCQLYLRDRHSPGSESLQTVNPPTKHLEPATPSHVSQADVALLERLFDRSPDVAFFVKDALGRYVAVNESLVNHLEMHWHRPHAPVWCLTTKLPMMDSSGAPSWVTPELTSEISSARCCPNCRFQTIEPDNRFLYGRRMWHQDRTDYTRCLRRSAF